MGRAGARASLELLSDAERGGSRPRRQERLSQRRLRRIRSTPRQRLARRLRARPGYVQTVRVSVPLLGPLILVVSACGGSHAEPSAARPAVVRELHVQSDYGQIYIYDRDTQAWHDTDTEDDNPLVRALEDGSDSR